MAEEPDPRHRLHQLYRLRENLAAEMDAERSPGRAILAAVDSLIEEYRTDGAAGEASARHEDA